jgi:hypothetical protein
VERRSEPLRGSEELPQEVWTALARSREPAHRAVERDPLDAIQPVTLLRDDRWQREQFLRENMTPQLLAAFRMLVDPRQERSRLLPTDRHRLSPSSLGR